MKLNVCISVFRFSAFDVNHETIGNGNDDKHISTSAFELKCHPNYYPLTKILLARCSEDLVNDFYAFHLDYSK